MEERCDKYSMLIYDLLDKKEKNKLELIQLCEMDSSDTISMDYLTQTLNISKATLISLVEDIQEDLKELHLDNVSLELLKKSQVFFKGAPDFSSKRLIPNYAEHSILFMLLKFIFFGQITSLTHFSDEYFFSYSTISKKFTELKKILKTYDIYINNQYELHGDEEVIREVMACIFFLIDELDENENIQLIGLVDQLMQSVPLQSQTLSHQLWQKNFLAVTIVRIQHGYCLTTINQNKLFHENFDVATLKKNIISLRKRISKQALNFEINNILSFFICTQDEVQLNITCVSPYFYQLSQLFFKELKKKCLCDFSESMYSELMLLNYRLVNFPYIKKASLQPIDLQFFSEAYPEVIQFVVGFIERNIDDIYSDVDTMFTEYLLFILNCLPKEKITKKIKICVSFSSGIVYETFIKNNILSLVNSYIEFVEYPGSDCDIFITDLFYLRNSFPDTVILLWLVPPRPSDWGNFVDLFNQAKKEKLEEKLSIDN